MASSPRIALIGMHIESNAFAPVTTGDDFRASCYLVEDEIVAEAARPAPAMPAEIPGFVDEMNRAGAWEPAPILVAATEPGGPVDHGFFTATIDEMRSRLARRLPLDAVYVSNHGAMISTGSFDADGELYRMVRDVVGPRVPVVAAVDLHANISDEMVASTDAIISYRTNPHVDQAERAAEAARLLLRMLDGRTLAPAILRLPIVAPTVTLLTARGPYADLIAAGQAASGSTSSRSSAASLIPTRRRTVSPFSPTAIVRRRWRATSHGRPGPTGSAFRRVSHLCPRLSRPR